MLLQNKLKRMKCSGNGNQVVWHVTGKDAQGLIGPDNRSWNQFCRGDQQVAFYRRLFEILQYKML